MLIAFISAYFILKVNHAPVSSSGALNNCIVHEEIKGDDSNFMVTLVAARLEGGVQR